MRQAFGIARLVAAAVCVVALIARLVWSLGISGPIVANFFSYFTMDSAIAATFLWSVGGVYALRNVREPYWLTTLRPIVISYQIVSGIVFAIITWESINSGFPLVVPWSSDVLHYVLPVYALADWLASPGRVRPGWYGLRFILVFPLIWCVYTIARGAVVGWYPYFFLDPTQVNPAEATLFCFLAAVIIVVVGACVVALGRRVPSIHEHAPFPRLRVSRRR